MSNEIEPLSTRVVRIVHQVRPRWLTAKSVCDACKEDRSDLVYTTLNNYASGAKAPLIKRRSDGGGGAVEYTTRDGFDLDRWIDERTQRKRVAPGADDSLDICVRVVQTIRQYDKRLTAADLESTGRFPDRKALLVNLAQLCDEGEPLARDRRAGEPGAPPPYEYGIKPGFNVAVWLSERGASLDLSGLGAPPPLQQPAGPKATARAPAKTAAPQARTAPEETSKPEGRDRTGLASAPAVAAAPAGARIVRGRDTVDDAGQSEDRPKAAPAAAANDRLSLARPPAASEQPAVSPQTKAQAIPTPRADRTPAPPTDPRELVIIAAACLASTVRLHVTGISECAALTRALEVFEDADRAYVRARAGAPEQQTGRAA